METIKKINKNVGSDYDNLRQQKSDTIYKLIQEFIDEFNVEVLSVKYDRQNFPCPELFAGHFFERNIIL